MTVTIPEGGPQTLGEAFGHIYTVQTPSIDDLKEVVLVEAAGLALYEKTAKGTDNPQV